MENNEPVEARVCVLDERGCVNLNLIYVNIETFLFRNVLVRNVFQQ